MSFLTPTPVPFNVNIPANSLADLSNVALSVAITHATLADLSLVLQAPNGDQITLVQNQNNAAGTAISTGIGITGANLGIINGFDVGTNFDDSATRNIFDPNTTGTNANAAPFIGDYRPERSPGDTLPFFKRYPQELPRP